MYNCIINVFKISSVYLFCAALFELKFVLLFHWYKSVAIFCRQVAAWVPDMFWNFYLVKNHKIANTTTTTDAREKMSTDLEYLEF